MPHARATLGCRSSLALYIQFWSHRSQTFGILGAETKAGSSPLMTGHFSKAKTPRRGCLFKFCVSKINSVNCLIKYLFFSPNILFSLRVCCTTLPIDWNKIELYFVWSTPFIFDGFFFSHVIILSHKNDMKKNTPWYRFEVTPTFLSTASTFKLCSPSDCRPFTFRPQEGDSSYQCLPASSAPSLPLLRRAVCGSEPKHPASLVFSH